MGDATLPRLYTELADWWPLLSPPEDYRQEAARFADLLAETAAGPVRTLLELGSGGGHTACHLKGPLQVTLTDLSEEMLAVSRRLNPECEHVQGDMRTLRLGRTFDAVLVHDAVSHFTDARDLGCVVETAFAHCRPGGAALFVPDCVRETFAAGTDHGGVDGPDGRALRYVEWTWDPDPDDTTYRVERVMLLREGEDRPVRVVHDPHELGVFARDEWMDLLARAGFEARWREDTAVPGLSGLFAALRPE